MNMDEVIAVLQESLRQNKAIEESPNVFFSSKDIVGGALKNVRRRTTALEMAIAALSAQQTPAKLDRSRWEECPDCWLWESLNKFCPYCGKPQTEEAWAELERRITDET